MSGLSRGQQARAIYRDLKVDRPYVSKVWVEWTDTYIVQTKTVRTRKFAVMAMLNNCNVNAGVGDTLEEAIEKLKVRLKTDPQNSRLA